MAQKDPKRTPSSSNHPFPGALGVSFMEGYVFSAQGFPRAHCCQAAHGGRWAAAEKGFAYLAISVSMCFLYKPFYILASSGTILFSTVAECEQK